MSSGTMSRKRRRASGAEFRSFTCVSPHSRGAADRESISPSAGVRKSWVPGGVGAPLGTTARRILFRALLQIGDHVRAVLGAVEMEEHPHSGDEGLRIGEPLVERLLVPDDIGGFERVGIAVIRE